jgi:ornithine carbamoyltransferase
MRPDAQGHARRHLLSLRDLEPRDLSTIARRAVDFAQGETAQSLRRRRVGIYFRRSSTRTRIAFTAAALELGADVVTIGPDDLQTSTGETVEDTARVLASYLDALVVRTNDELEELRRFACHDAMPVVNALTGDDHPTQALADLATILEAFGRLEGIRVLYLGGGNSTSASLALALAQVAGSQLVLATPADFPLPQSISGDVERLSAAHGGEVIETHDLDAVPRGVDVIYTSRWQTMGRDPGPDPDWRAKFEPFRVTSELVECLSNERTIFMHDLPAARGSDVEDAVLDGPRSWAFRQAYHKMTAAMATLEWVLGVLPPGSDPAVDGGEDALAGLGVTA